MNPTFRPDNTTNANQLPRGIEALERRAIIRTIYESDITNGYATTDYLYGVETEVVGPDLTGLVRDAYLGYTLATYLPSRTSRTSTPQPEMTENEYKDFKVAEIEGYICPISLEIMTDPVSIKGHETSGTFERSAIENWLSVKNTHPLTNQIVTDKTLVPNTELQKAIEDFKKSSEKNNPSPR